MIIYNSEKECGISDLFLAVSSTVPLLSVSKNNLNLKEDTLQKISQAFDFRPDIDLYPVFDILVSTGLNKNDEYFAKDEVLKALGSSINKPFNIGHNPVRIIGHIFGDKLIDDSFNILDSSKELPANFHVITGSVIYTQKGRGAELEGEMSTILQQIEAGEWYVSVEALFPKFDYYLVNDKETKIVERNEETSFLSKYLRIYGGEGVYKDYRIGRKLMNIVFSGKGLVHKPANSNSIILNSNSGEVTMAEDKRDFEKELAGVKAELETLQAAKTEAEASLVKANEKVAELEKVVADKEAKVLSLSSDVEAVTKELEVERTKIAELTLQGKKASRTSVLVEGGVEKTVAEDLVNKTINTEDGVFDILVASQIELVKAKKTPEVKVEKTEEEVAVAAEAKLEKAEEETEVTYSSEDVKVDKAVLEDIAKFLE